MKYDQDADDGSIWYILKQIPGDKSMWPGTVLTILFILAMLYPFLHLFLGW